MQDKKDVTGADRGTASVAEQVPGFDFIFYGHDHNAYKSTITNSDGKIVHIANPGNDAKNVAEITVKVSMSGKKVAGSIGLISVQALTESGIKSVKAAAFELDTDMLAPYPSRTNEYKHLPTYPLVEQDLSLLVDESVTWEQIRESIKYMVKELKFVEEYRGKQIPAGKKSVMLSLKIGNDDSTMTSKQIEKKMNGIIKVLSNKCKAELR